MTRGKIAGVPVDISRTGYTGDLGYEIWVPQNGSDAVKVWDALVEKGKQFDLHAAGMLALDVARVEAGLLLIEVDYSSSKKALIPSQKYSPYELGFAKMVHLEKENFIGRRALEQDAKNGVQRQLVGVEVDWTDVEALLRALWTYSGCAEPGFACGGAAVFRREAGRESDDDELVAHPEEDGRAGQRGDRAFEIGDAVGDGDHDRGHPAEDECKGDCVAVL